MPDTDPDGESTDEVAVAEGSETGEQDGESVYERTVERGFTCSLCGYVMAHEVGALRAEVQSVCHNCGEWTTQVADRTDLAGAAEEAAAALAGPVLTERQALAYLLREVLDADREVAAEVMDTSASNVDNLHRRATEKVGDAERVVEALGSLRVGEESDESGTEGGG
jgi:hypothetical protein